MEKYNPLKVEPKWSRKTRSARRGVNKKYNPPEVESKWQKVWEAKLSFKALDFDKKRKKFYALVEFPYPSGEGLHIGHAFTFTILDVFVRKKRMEGANVLYPMGWDAFGLPTENFAIKTGVHPAVATKKNTDRFRDQMKRLAFAYNWDREIDTTDPSYYKWTQWIFIQLFKNGLAYKKRMPINWCPSCRIGLANEEVVAGKCERCGAQVGQKELDQWLLRITAYADRLADELDLVDFPESVVAAQRNWIGRSEGVEEYWKVVGMDLKLATFTTWLHTSWGATFIVIAPEHPVIEKLVRGTKYEKSAKEFCQKIIQEKIKDFTSIEKEKKGLFIGRYAINHLTGEKIPIFIANFAVMEYGTGIVKGCPAHDQRDWDFAKKYNLKIRPVIKPKNKSITTPYIGEGLMINAGPFTGMDTKKAREAITDYVIASGNGKRAVNYHLRDWIFSRQHYWGEPIPMVYCPKCAKKGVTWWQTKKAQSSKLKTRFSTPRFSGEKTSDVVASNYNLKLKTKDTSDGGRLNPELVEGGSHDSSEVEELKKTLAGWFPVPESQLPVKLPRVKRYQPTGTGESPLAAVKDWVKTRCPVCRAPARRETDTMPNWAGSSWYFLRYIDPKNDKALADKKKLRYWMPVDLYLGGAEHTTLHLLYSRFWHKFLFDLKITPGKEPYLARRVHGVVLGEDGFRMSKSRGNVINPEEVMDKFGVDTLRVYLMFMGPYDQTMPWSTKGVRGVYRFLSRVWRLAQEVAPATTKYASEVEEKLLRLMHQTIKKVTEDIETMKFNTAIAALMEYLNKLQATSYKLQAEEYKEAIKILLLLLAPFAPYVTEELWQRLRGGKGSNPLRKTSEASRLVEARSAGETGLDPEQWSIHQQPWPKFDERLVKEEEVKIAIEVNGKVRGEIKIKSQISNLKSQMEKKAKEDPKVKKYLRGKKIKRVIFLPSRLINFVLE